MSWRPFSTAPTEPGSRADLWIRGERYTDCVLHPHRGWTHWCNDGYDGRSLVRVPSPITHWMPVPDPPPSLRKEEGQ